jgi:aminoglycoside phosphotransferase (APT) family kinase protein
LPKFGPFLPLRIPMPLAMGASAHGYPCNWSIYRWLAGGLANLRQCAISLAGFLLALQRIDPAGGPAPGPHHFYRGGSLKIYDAQTCQAIRDLAGTID